MPSARIFGSGTFKVTGAADCAIKANAKRNSRAIGSYPKFSSAYSQSYSQRVIVAKPALARPGDRHGTMSGASVVRSEQEWFQKSRRRSMVLMVLTGICGVSRDGEKCGLGRAKRARRIFSSAQNVRSPEGRRYRSLTFKGWHVTCQSK
jgi:hypothetical protein